jgi:hypothetical protein
MVLEGCIYREYRTGQDIRILGFKDIRIIRIGHLRHDWAG